MKDFLKKLKKALGAETDDRPEYKEPVQAATPAVTPENSAQPKASVLPPAPEKREEIIRFIIHALRPYVNETNTGIKGIKLYILCGSKEEETLANIALYADKPNAFKTGELQRKLSDNYISPDAGWFFEYTLVRDKLPDCMFTQHSLGLDVVKSGQLTGNITIAGITVISGQLEMEEYLLDPKKKQKYTIGRSKTPILPSGAMHTNDIVFINKDEPGFDPVKGANNMFVSRNHAIIFYNAEQRSYFITADKGGIPESANKTKLFTTSGQVVRLDIAGASHEIHDGDQVELGGNARLLFSQPAGSLKG